MSRLFDNNVSNYMSRSSVNFGLNGAVALSVAMWIRFTAVSGTQFVAAKEIVSGWNTFSVNCSAGAFQFEIVNNAALDYANWNFTAPTDGLWHRYLFAWAVTGSADITDATVHLDGVETSTTFGSSGYTSGFTLEEATSNYLLGLHPVNLLSPLNGALAWVCVWNRKLSALEAQLDYTNPQNNPVGKLSQVEVNPDTDQGAIGGSMTVNGTLADAGHPPIRIRRPTVARLRPAIFTPGLAR